MNNVFENKFRAHTPRFSRPRRREDEEIVQNDLAVTPAEMLEMANDGTPISAQNLGLVYDEGYSDLDFEVPLQYQRGVDICDLWEAREDVRAKFGKQAKTLADNGMLGQTNHNA